jgi:signal transduction histidine kinase
VLAHHDAAGRDDGFSIIAHDMTQWLKGEQELRELHEEQRRLSAQLIAVQETERHRIAADIHDSIGQSLSLIKLQVSTAEAQLKSGANSDALATLNSLLPRVQNAIGEVRRVATDLHPSMLEDLGILPTLTWFFRELETAFPGIRIEKQFSVMEHEVPRALRIVIFRILQEAVSNIVKHAAPQSINVKLKRSTDRLYFDIEDDGLGFDPKTIMGIDYSGRGFGLSSMKERARFSGGVYVLRSSVGQGTSIHVEWPLRKHDQEAQ